MFKHKDWPACKAIANVCKFYTEILDENQERAFIMRHGWNLGLGQNGSYVKNCGIFLKSINVVYDEMINYDELKKAQPDFYDSFRKYEDLLERHKFTSP